MSAATVSAGSPSQESPGRALLQGRPFPAPALLVPLVLVNAAAVWGQAGWGFEHLGGRSWPMLAKLALSILFAVAVESIGVYLALEAHQALMNDQAAGLLRFGSYGIGVLAGGLNYWHFADHGGQPTPTAITFGLLSSISPWLWAIRSRSMNRVRLDELGLIDKRGVKLSMNRKFWHPVKSLRVIRWASWEGIVDPEEAVRGWELTRERPDAPVSSPPALPEGPRTPAEWVAAAEAVRAGEPGITWEQVAEKLGCSDRHLRNCRRAVAS